MVVADLPFMSYQTSVEDAMRNAGRLLQEGGCQAVKLEGGVLMAETVRRLVQVGIPVVGHIGLTPQSINQLGGYKVQGRTPEAAERLLEDAVALQQAGAFRYRARDGTGAAGRVDQPAAAHSDIGIGAGVGLRRAGAGLARPAVLPHDVPDAAHPAARQGVRQRRRRHAETRSSSTPQRCATAASPHRSRASV